MVRENRILVPVRNSPLDVGDVLAAPLAILDASFLEETTCGAVQHRTLHR